MAAFYTEAIEPRSEFAAQRRQTPTEVSLWYNNLFYPPVLLMRNRGIFSLLSRRNCYIACGTNEKIPFIDYKKEPDLARSSSFL